MSVGVRPRTWLAATLAAVLGVAVAYVLVGAAYVYTTLLVLWAALDAVLLVGGIWLL